MTIVLIFIMIGIFFLGYLIMLRVDKFIAKGCVIESPEARRKMGILIFGSEEAVSEARREGIQYIELREPVLPENNYSYSAILILSNNESENLALCQAAYKYDPDICIVVRCENKNMKPVFEQLGANCFVMPGSSIKSVLSEVWRALK